MLPDTLVHGERTDVTVTDREGPAGSVRLLVDGATLMLGRPGRLAGAPLEPGRYEFTAVVPVDPEVVAAVEEWLRRADPECPDRGGQLQHDPPIVDAHRHLLEPGDRPLLVPTAEATTARLDTDEYADCSSGSAGTSTPRWTPSETRTSSRS